MRIWQRLESTESQRPISNTWTHLQRFDFCVFSIRRFFLSFTTRSTPNWRASLLSIASYFGRLFKEAFVPTQIAMATRKSIDLFLIRWGIKWRIASAFHIALGFVMKRIESGLSQCTLWSELKIYPWLLQMFTLPNDTKSENICEIMKLRGLSLMINENNAVQVPSTPWRWRWKWKPLEFCLLKKILTEESNPRISRSCRRPHISHVER